MQGCGSFVGWTRTFGAKVEALSPARRGCLAFVVAGMGGLQNSWLDDFVTCVLMYGRRAMQQLQVGWLGQFFQVGDLFFREAVVQE